VGVCEEDSSLATDGKELGEDESLDEELDVSRTKDGNVPELQAEWDAVEDACIPNMEQPKGQGVDFDGMLEALSELPPLRLSRLLTSRALHEASSVDPKPLL